MNLRQIQGSAGIEPTIKLLIKLAEENVTKAQSQADATEAPDDLDSEADESPESIILSSVSGYLLHSHPTLYF